jgi:hypothetical protein
MRRIFAAAALALFGCHDEPEILVHNQGSQPAIVEIVSDDFTWRKRQHDLVELPPGAIYKNDYAGDEVEVVIWRKGDGLILFASVFDREDFADEHGTIEIVVIP